MKIKEKILVYTFASFALLSFLQKGAAAQERPFEELEKLREELTKTIVLSPRQEIKIGKKIATAINKKKKILYSSHPAYLKLTGLRKSLEKYRKSRGVPIKIYIEKSRIINAYAIAGGHIWFTTGILDFVKNIDELAGILAHELGHIDLLHSQRNLVPYYMTIQATRNEDIATLTTIGARILDRPFSQSDETASDIYAAKLLRKAGFDVGEFANFFLKLERKTKMDRRRKKIDPLLDRILYTHPMNQNRYRRLKKYTTN